MKIFLSAVSAEFMSHRNALASDLRAVGAEVVVQEDFQQHGRTLLQKLENYIGGCDRVIALVGNAYGWEPELSAMPPDMPRRSYTQWEYFFAQGERLDGTRQRGKDIFAYFASPDLLRLSQVSEPVEQAALQQEFIAYIRRNGKDHSYFGSLHELRALVLRDGFRIAERPSASTTLPDYDGRIKNFLDEYLGTTSSPVPFGGREKELEALDDWLTDPMAPPYAMIAAEAGRGKSALLAHWTKSILDRAFARVIFIPISIRFNTALSSVIFPALASALAEIFDEPMIRADLSAEQWRSVCLRYMRRSPPDGGTLLVILDGLDEASDWQAGPDLFAVSPPSGMRALVSARYLAGDVDERGWLRRLGWDLSGRAFSIPLPPLSRGGVSDVLEAMGNPLGQLATQVDVVGELFRLSQGDPLLVRLYVEALLSYGEGAATLKPGDLPSIRDGLEGYFERWWDDQARRSKGQGRAALAENADVRDFLNVCATALGPLSRDDVAEIVAGPLASGLRLREIAREVDRFVIGDGHTRGYVFSHPRLGQFFWEQMTVLERSKWETRFLEYGRRTLEALEKGQIVLGSVSPYTIQYYGAHMERAGAPAKDLYALVTQGWLRGWEAMEGTHAGFLNDIERAWRSAESIIPRIASEDIAILIKCALCRSSIAALSVNISPRLLVLCVNHRILTPLQALIIVRQIPDRWRYCEAVSTLAPVLSSDLMPEALTAVLEITQEDDRATALIALVPLLEEELKAKAIQEALLTLREIDSEDQATALTALAPQLPEAMKPSAVQLAGEIEDRRLSALTLSALSSYCQEPMRAEIEQRALAAARKIEDERSRTDLLIELLPKLSEPLKAEVMQEAFAMALTLPEGKGLSASNRADAIAGLAAHLGEAMKVEALVAAQAMQNPDEKVIALTGLVPHLPEALRQNVVREALAAVKAINGNEALASASIGLAPYLPEAWRVKVLGKALEAARAIQDVERRPMVLSSLGAYLPRQLFRQALAAAEAEDGWSRAIILESLAPRLSEHLLREALKLVEAMDNDGSRISAWLALSEHLPAPSKKQALREMLAWVREITDEHERAEVLIALAPRLPNELLSEALALGEAEGARVSVGIAIGLAPNLPDAMKAEATRKALSAARAIKDNAEQVGILIALAPYLPSTGQMSAEILQEAQTTGDKRQQVRALTNLVPYLPKDLKAQALARALSIAQELPEWDLFSPRTVAIIALAPYLTEPLRTEALDAARKTSDGGERALVLAGLAKHAPKVLKARLAKEALQTARAIKNDQHRAFALDHIVPSLPKRQWAKVVEEAIAAARASTYPITLAAVVQRLAPYMSKELQEHVVDTVLPYLDDELLSETLTSFAPYLPLDLLRRGHRLAQEIEDDDYRAAAVAASAPYRPETDAVEEAMDTLLRIQSDWIRAKGLANLAAHLPDRLKQKALQEAMTALPAIPENLREDALNALAPLLPDWARAHPVQAYSILSKTLRDFSRRPRPIFLPILRRLLPCALALVRKGEEETAVRIHQAVQNTARWWP